MPLTADTDANEVTLAVLGEKMDQNTRMLTGALEKQDKTEAEVVVLKIEQAKIKERMRNRTIVHSFAEAAAAGFGIAALFSK